MAENQLMAQGNPQTVSPNEPHDVHIPIHQQMAGNQIIDAHIVEHGKYMGLFANMKQRAQQNGSPQQGDTSFPTQSVTPELTRESIPNEGQIQGSSMNRG